MLAELRNVTYLIQENDALNKLEEHLHRILALAKKFVPSDEGLKLEGPSTLLPCKRSKQGGKTCGKKKMRANPNFKELPKRIKRKQKYSGRHGSRATMMRKNFQVHIPVSTIPATTLKIEPQTISPSLQIQQQTISPSLRIQIHPHASLQADQCTLNIPNLGQC